MTIINGKDHKEYFVQKTRVSTEFKSRIDLFKNFIENKKVLHVGFVDWPITDPNSSLHLNLKDYCTQLDGYDVNTEGAEFLKVPNGNIYHNWNDVPNDYDVILVPEVIEHVSDVKTFIDQVCSKNGIVIITAPCAFQLQHHFQNSDEFLEAVHPDHNCYYSPYTLRNVIEKYSNRTVSQMHWVNRQSIVAVCL